MNLSLVTEVYKSMEIKVLSRLSGQLAQLTILLRVTSKAKRLPKFLRLIGYFLSNRPSYIATEP